VKSALVTGANGLIGSEVCRRLHGRGVKVRALAGPPSGEAAPPPDVELLRGDILDLPLLRRATEDVDVVVHLAGPPSVAASFEDPIHFVRVHVEGTATLLEACCRQRALRRVVYVSSAEIYGPGARSPVREDDPANPASPYGAAKVGAEALTRAFELRSGIETVALRPFSVYGPGQQPRSLLAELIRQVASGDAPRLRDPRPVRDFVHVRDVARAVELACVGPLTAPWRAFNIASGHGVSTGTVAAMLSRLAGVPEGVAHAEPPDRPTRGAILELIADTSRARAELGFAAEIDLQQGLRELYDHARGISS
jgi:nucleoside-diphosphate-sugar epimerase